MRKPISTAIAALLEVLQRAYQPNVPKNLAVITLSYRQALLYMDLLERARRHPYVPEYRQINQRTGAYRNTLVRTAIDGQYHILDYQLLDHCGGAERASQYLAGRRWRTNTGSR